jgi:hypothetical protein
MNPCDMQHQPSGPLLHLIFRNSNSKTVQSDLHIMLYQTLSTTIKSKLHQVGMG